MMLSSVIVRGDDHSPRLEILRSSEEQFVRVLNEMNTTQARRRDASHVMWMVVFWTGISLRHGVDGRQ